MVCVPGSAFSGPHGLQPRPREEYSSRSSGVHGSRTSTLTTSDVFDYARRQDQWRRRHRWSVVRVLRAMCDRVGRADTRGGRGCGDCVMATDQQYFNNSPHIGTISSAATESELKIFNEFTAHHASNVEERAGGPSSVLADIAEPLTRRSRPECREEEAANPRRLQADTGLRDAIGMRAYGCRVR